jgi:leucyl aminopeptidase
MKVSAEHNFPLKIETEMLAIGIYENLDNSKPLIDDFDSKLEGMIKERMEMGDLDGKIGKITILYSYNKLPAKRILLVGLGKKEDLNYEIIRRVSGIVVKKIRGMGIKSYKFWLMGSEKSELKTQDIAQAIAEGTILANYKLLKHKTEKEKLNEIKFVDELTVVHDREIEEVKEGIETGKIIAEASNFAKNLTNEPANIVTPTYFAEQARKMAEEVSISSKVHDEKEIEELKMGAFLSVARGSKEPCKLVVLEYNPKENLDTIVLVGKGITFDTGGIGIKSASGMLEMKQDMAGAAAVIAVLKIVAQLNIPLHVVAIAPLTENALSGEKANFPGDIVRSRMGKTIEILNTDAEGRLILADALDYANEFNPKIVIDIATLTGACRIALGTHTSGLFTPDDELAEKLIEAGEQTEERLWRLPLWKEHEKAIESKFADVRNINPNSNEGAGASVAAAFLKQFIGDYRWAHVDIAGTDFEYKGTDYTPWGASGVGIRLLVQFLRNWIKK